MLSFGQDDDLISAKKGRLIGFSVNTTDFTQPINVSNSFLSGNFNPGFSVLYWEGLSNRIDFSFRYNGIFTSYTKSNSNGNSDYVNEFEASIHARGFKDNHLFQPFLSAGIGAGGYGGRWTPYAPLGGGFQFNFSGITYLFIQMNYRASFSKSNLDNNLFYSFGVAQTLSRPKPPAPKL